MVVDLDDDLQSVSTSPAIMLSKPTEDDGLNKVESSDVEDSSGGFFQQFLTRMSPVHCLTPDTACGGINIIQDDDATVDFDKLLPGLVRDLQKGGRPRSNALLRLYRVTDRTLPENRVRLVHAKVSVWEGLSPCLAADANVRDRRQALLLLNNLCIPMENKKAIVLGDGLDIVVPSLMGILREQLPECYLAAVCLYNLSFLSDAKEILYDFTPHVTCDRVRSSYRFNEDPGNKPDTLFAVVEGMCQAYKPFLRATVDNRNSVVQAEAIRWSLGYVRNLCVDAGNAHQIVKTSFPQLVGDYLANEAPSDMTLWTKDSLPDACLMLLVQLVAFEDCLLPLLSNKQVMKGLSSLEGRGGIHETRARAILARLREEEGTLEGIIVDETKGEF